MKKIIFASFLFLISQSGLTLSKPEIECSDYKSGRGTQYKLHYKDGAPIELGKQTDYMEGMGMNCDYLNMSLDLIFDQYTSSEYTITCGKNGNSRKIIVSDSNKNIIETFKPYPVSDNKNFCEALVNEINRIIDADFRQTIEEEVEESLSTLGNINSGDCPKSERP